MLEEDLPYQQSWFDDGFPCAGKKNSKNIDPICYSHSTPTPQQLKKIHLNYRFEFRDIGSSSIEVVRVMAKWQVPVTVSILAHPEMWKLTKNSGDIFLNSHAIETCKLNPKACSGHAALITGYDLDKKIFFFKNSWGPAWGDGGYGTIPFDYMDQMSERRFLIGQVAI